MGDTPRTREQVEHEIENFRAQLAELEATLRSHDIASTSHPDAKMGPGKAEDMRREDNEFFRTITESLPGAVFSYDLDMDDNRSPVYAGPGFAALVGPETAKQIDGATVDTFFELIHPEDYQAMRQAGIFDPSFCGPVDQEYRVRTESGSYKWVRSFARPSRQPNGKLRWHGILIDITDQKKAEDTQRHLDFVLRSCPAVVYRCGPGPDLPTTFISENITALFGYNASDFLQDSRFWEKRIHPDDAPRILRDLKQIYVGRSLSHEYRFLRKDGQYVWVHDQQAPLFDDEGIVIGLTGSWYDITDRKAAEAALQVSEKRFRAFFEQAAVGAAQIETATGRFVQVNSKYCEFMGYTPDEMTATTFMAITHPDDLQQDLDEMERLKGGQIRSFAMRKRLLRRDNSIVWVNLTVSPMWKSGEKPTFHIAIVEDITERKRMEEELRESKGLATRQLAELKDLYDTAPVGLCLMDTDLRFVRINDTLAAINGTTAENHIGRTLHDVVPEIAGSLDKIQRSVLDTGKPILNIDVKGSTPAQPSVERHWLCSYTPVRTEDGQIYGVNTVVSEITSQKRAEEVLRRYEHIVSTTSDLMAFVDCNYVYRTVNDAYISAFKTTRPDIIGRSVGEMLGEENFERVVKPNLDRCLSGEHINYQAWFTFPLFGKLYMDVVYSPFRDEAGTVSGVTVSARDISQRWRTERERDHLRAKLNQSQKLQAVGQLAAGVAHDFNSILMVVLGNTELIRRGASYEQAASAADKTALDQILDAVERGRGMIQKLLTFGRTQQARPQLVNLNEVISQMKTLLAGLVGEATTIEEKLCDDLPQINIDAGQIEQVIMNLVLNSRDAMPNGGTLTIETTITRLSESQVAARADAKPGPHVTISVRDTGHGMPQSTMNRMFEPFFTSKPIDKGTGLGLSIVHGIVSQAGGHIGVTSLPNRGTTFTLHFPVATKG